MGLTKDEFRELHDAITGQGYSYQEILELAKAMLGFGNPLKEKDTFGREVEKSEYSLHLQCPWRIKNIVDARIVLASTIFMNQTPLLNGMRISNGIFMGITYLMKK